MPRRSASVCGALALLFAAGGCRKVISLGNVVEDGGLRINLTCSGILKDLGANTSGECNLNSVVGSVIAGAVGATTVHVGDMVEVEGQSPGVVGAGLALITANGQQSTVEFLMPAFQWQGSVVVVVPMVPVTELGSGVDSLLLGVNSATPLKLNVVANTVTGGTGAQTGLFVSSAQGLSSFLTAPTGPQATFFSTILTDLGPIGSDANGLVQNAPGSPVQVGGSLSLDANGVSLMDQLVTGVLEPVISPAPDAGPGQAEQLSSQTLAEQALPLVVALATAVTLTSTEDGGIDSNGIPDVIAASTAFLPLAAEVNDAVQLAVAGADGDIQAEQAAWGDLGDTCRLAVIEALDAGTVSLQGSFQTDATTALQDTLGSAGAFDAGCVVNGCPAAGCSNPGGVSTCVTSSVCNPATGLCNVQSTVCSPKLCLAADAGCSCQ